MYIFIIVIFAILVVLIADYIQAKNIREINNKIVTNPQFLNDPDKRDLSEKTLKMIAYVGPFTLLEVKKLKKALGK